MRAEASLVAVALAAAIVAPIGPVQMTYVYSDSMSPALQADDGFILVPAGTVEEGDIVTFRSNSQDGYVTHRVVERTPEGLITKGDANPSTDQAAGAPPVQRSQVVGEVLTVAGTPVTIPGVGLVASLVERYLSAIAVATLLLSGWWLWSAGRTESRDRKRDAPATAGTVMMTVVVLTAAGLVLLPALGSASQTVQYEVVDGTADGTQTISTDEAVVRTIPLELDDGTDRVAVAASGMTVLEQTREGTQLELTVEIPPAESAGQATKAVRVYSYPPLAAPPSVLDRLEAIHPLAAVGASIASVLGPVYALGLVVIDRHRRLRFREQSLQELV